MIAVEGVEQLRQQLLDALETATELYDLDEQGVEVEIDPRVFRKRLWALILELQEPEE